MILTRSDFIKRYTQEIRNKVGNFDLKIQTSAILHNFFKVKGYEFFFTPNLIQIKKGKSLDKTPDFQAHKVGKADIIGEIKQGLPNPLLDNYDKKVGKDLIQLESYSEDLVGISTPHDVFFSSPSWCNEAISYYVDKISQNALLKDRVIVLKYHWTKGTSHNELTISKVYGDFTDSDINQEFRYKDYRVGEDDLAQIQGYYKILYTEEEYNGTPVEYIMLVLWHNIFPELIKTAEFDRTMERIKIGQNTLRFKLDEIMEIIDKIYTLKTSAIGSTKQFSQDMIIDAMEGFVQLKRAQKLNDSKINPEYIVTHSKIVSNREDFITDLIMELHKVEFDKKAEIEYQKQLNKDLNEVSSNKDI